MNNFSDALNEFENYLSRLSTQMVSDLQNILTMQTIPFMDSKSQTDMAALFFEYDYEWLDIFFYGVDKELEPVTNTVKLPSKLLPESHGDTLQPEVLHEFEINVEDEFDFDNNDEDEFYEQLDEYKDKKSEIFESWFSQCWDKATKNPEAKPEAFFSVHDTAFKTDLNRAKTAKEVEIIKLLAAP
jgi:hypothetical protein